jgi:hypothetical protein
MEVTTMTKYKFTKAICLHITTYENLNPKGEELVRFIQRIYEYFKPLLNFKLGIIIAKMNNRENNYEFNEKNLKKLYDLLLQGEVQQFHIGDYQEEGNEDPYGTDEEEIIEYPPLFSLAASCNHAATYPAHFSDKLMFFNDFSFALNERLFDNSIPFDIQNFFIELFGDSIKALSGSTGYITYETTAAGGQIYTLFESYYRINTCLPPGYNHSLRGYFWLNYLSKEHIAKLNGLEDIMANAPGYMKQVIEMDDNTGVMLQLTEDINNYSDTKLLSLRNYLYPILVKQPNGELSKEDITEFIPEYKIRLVE